MAPGEVKSSEDDIIVAVVGADGSGKSTFISQFLDQVPVDNGISSIRTYSVHSPRYGKSIVLVDTPGFNGTNQPDTEVLKLLDNELALEYERDVELAGLIYLHKMTDLSMAGINWKKLDLFKKLCGSKYHDHIMLVTTMWDRVSSQAVGSQREQELLKKREYWGIMSERGGAAFRHTHTEQSAVLILDSLIQKRGYAILDDQQPLVPVRKGHSQQVSEKGGQDTMTTILQGDNNFDPTSMEPIKHRNNELQRQLERQQEELRKQLANLQLAQREVELSLAKVMEETEQLYVRQDNINTEGEGTSTSKSIFTSLTSPIHYTPTEKSDHIESLDIGTDRATGTEQREEQRTLQAKLADARTSMLQIIERAQQNFAMMIQDHQSHMQGQFKSLRAEQQLLNKSLVGLHDDRYEQLKAKYLKQVTDNSKTQKVIVDLKSEHKAEALRYEEKVKATQTLLDVTIEARKSQQTELDLQEEKIRELQRTKKNSEEEKKDVLMGTLETKTLPKNRMSEGITVSLAGIGYYLVGPAHSFWRSYATRKDTQRSMGVWLGTKDSWFRHYHEDEKCWTQRSGNLDTEYPKLAKSSESHKPHLCKARLSLGPNGYFFIKSDWGRSWSLPSQSMADINTELTELKIDRLWLGHESAYVATRLNGEVTWNLRGHYPTLKKLLDSWTYAKKIEDLALNIEDGVSWVLVTTDGLCASYGDTVPEKIWMKWTTANFGVIWA